LQDFDNFITIDWSSRGKPSPRRPSKDAIWLAQTSLAGRVSVKYFRTREACCHYLRKRLRHLARQEKKVLVGWDFSFGYPKGLAKALRLKEKPPWKSIWRMLHQMIGDGPGNQNNRFQVGADLNRKITGGSGPFWGVPAGQSGIFLGPKKDFRYPVTNRISSLAERRLVERLVPKMQPAWKLAYTGSVGSQALLGIPRVYQLAFADPELAAISGVWPFSTNFDRDIPGGPFILHAEIYPSLLPLGRSDTIPDRAQVRAFASFLREASRSGELADYLSVPEGLAKKEVRQVLRHEGWVLGVR
jgi:hypothetical protein